MEIYLGTGGKQTDRDPMYQEDPMNLSIDRMQVVYWLIGKVSMVALS